MASHDERCYDQTNFSCSTCWKVFADKDVCVEHMVGHFADPERSLEASDGGCYDSSQHNTADKDENGGDSLIIQRISGELESMENENSNKITTSMFGFEGSSLSFEKCRESDGQVSKLDKPEGPVWNTSKAGSRNKKYVEVIPKRTNCKYCDLECGDSVNLLKHERAHRPATKKMYICDVCKKEFTLHYRYLVHSRIHNDDRPHQCRICSKRFLEKTNLTTHMRYHTKSDLLHCAVCRREFIKKSALAKHMEVHSDERPYKCKHCESTFKREQHLERHLLKHSARRPRPYRCEKCDIAYLDRHGLNKHIQSYHNEKRDIIQTNFKTRNGKALIVDDDSVEGHVEKTIFEPIETEYTATESTLLELSELFQAGRAHEPEPPALKTTTGSVSASTQSCAVEVITISALPQASSVEPKISLVHSSELYQILPSFVENALLSNGAAPLELPVSAQISSVLMSDSSICPSSLALPREVQKTTMLAADSSEIPSSLRSALDAQSSTVLNADSYDIVVTLTNEADIVKINSSSEELHSLTLPLAMESPTTEAHPSEVTLKLPPEARSSHLATADSCGDESSFQVDRTGITSLQTEIQHSLYTSMPYLESPIPISSNMTITQRSDVVGIEKIQTDSPGTCSVQILPLNVANNPKNLVGNVSSPAMSKVHPAKVARKSKPTSNPPRRVVLKQKITEVPHQLWTYM